jgi:hypothetical protein
MQGTNVCGDAYVCDKAATTCQLCGGNGQDCCAGDTCPRSTNKACTAGTDTCN